MSHYHIGCARWQIQSWYLNRPYMSRWWLIDTTHHQSPQLFAYLRVTSFHQIVPNWFRVYLIGASHHFVSCRVEEPVRSLWDGDWRCEFLKLSSCSLPLSCGCVCVCVCLYDVHMCECTCIFSARGDPLLCQLFPMMLNSNRNIVSGENDFILWKTILPHSFISLRLPLSFDPSFGRL